MGSVVDRISGVGFTAHIKLLIRRESFPQNRMLNVIFGLNATVRDIVIGMADGLTVPFALAAGISGAAFLLARLIG